VRARSNDDRSVDTDESARPLPNFNTSDPGNAHEPGEVADGVGPRSGTSDAQARGWMYFRFTALDSDGLPNYPHTPVTVYYCLGGSATGGTPAQVAASPHLHDYTWPQARTYSARGGASQTAYTRTIKDNEERGTVSLSPTEGSVEEGESLRVTVRLSSTPAAELQVPWTAELEDDPTTPATFSPSSGTQTFAAGASGNDLAQSFDISIDSIAALDSTSPTQELAVEFGMLGGAGAAAFTAGPPMMTTTAPTRC